jgi:hypothetical protein
MFVLAFLVRLSQSTSTFSAILSGNWSGEVIYSRNLSPLPDLTFTISRSPSKYYLTTLFEGSPVDIYLSRTALAGNFSWHGLIFHFTLQETVSPLLSTTIRLRKLGLLHCTLGSDVAVRCLHVNRGKILSMIFRKTGFEPRPGLWALVRRNWRSLSLTVIFLLGRLAFKKYEAKRKADARATTALAAAEKEKTEGGKAEEKKAKTD